MARMSMRFKRYFISLIEIKWYFLFDHLKVIESLTLLLSVTKYGLFILMITISRK